MTDPMTEYKGWNSEKRRDGALMVATREFGGNNPLFGERVRRSMKTAAVCGRFLTLDSVVLLEATA